MDDPELDAIRNARMQQMKQQDVSDKAKISKFSQTCVIPARPDEETTGIYRAKKPSY